MSEHSGLFLLKKDLKSAQREDIISWLQTLKPIWEFRFSKNNPPPPNTPNRQLLRPVYWLGNWQFACLNYYHPPKGIENRCVKAEPYPPCLQKVVDQAEAFVHANYKKDDVPPGWKLNTCLINFYGDKIVNGQKQDCARVGEHKDFELGPVVSLSLGEKALFQFVKSAGKQRSSQVIVQQWLEDSDLQIFGTRRFKQLLFHRVQRVERRQPLLDLEIENFEVRRVNFTFRYVPSEHIKPWSQLPQTARDDTREYVEILAQNSPFFKQVLMQSDGLGAPASNP